MGMFDNYNKNSTEIPCNLYKFINVPEDNFIITGANCYNTFHLFYEYDEELLQDVSVTYEQVERLTLKKNDVEVIPLDNGTFLVKCNLGPEDTIKFGGTNLDTLAQVRFVYGNRVLYGAKVKINVLNTLDNN